MNGAPLPVPRLPRRVRFGGSPTTLRLLCPEDQARLCAFFESHTEETVRSRYGYTFSHLSPDRAAALVRVDQKSDVALGIFEGSEPDGRLLAVGRACRLPGGDSAELAFVVHEKWRRLGMATELFKVLVRILRRRGVGEVVAQVQQDNPAMLRVFERAGAEVAAITGTGSLAVRLRLSPPYFASVRT